MTPIEADILNPGTADGPVLVLDEPLSFWGAFDPRTGTIIDQHHPQRGQALTGHIVILPASRGSGGTPGGIAEAIRLNTGPKGIILGEPDINLAVGASVAGELYGVQCPVVAVDEHTYQTLTRQLRLKINESGSITGP